MKFLRVCAVVSALLVPSAAGADTISFLINQDQFGLLVFGQIPFHEYGPIIPNKWGQGFADLVSGPLVNLDIGVDGWTTYTYAAGVLNLDLSLDRGSLHETGSFSAPTMPFSFKVCDGCGFSAGYVPDFDILLGPGLFDSNLAALLQIDPHSLGGFLHFGLEDVTGDPLSEKRLGFEHGGWTTLVIEVRAVPEPALSMLMLLGAASWLARRTFRRA